jgi:hypothetical protein
MAFQQIGFLETAQATARWAIKYHQQAVDGVLRLRWEDDDGEVADLPILQEWRSAKGLLSRIRNGAAQVFQGAPASLGRAWIEVLPPLSGTPWGCDGGDYADAHLRTRVCLIPSPGAVSLAGGASAALPVGWLHAYDPRLLASEVNFGEHARVHLVVDVRRPDPQS